MSRASHCTTIKVHWPNELINVHWPNELTVANLLMVCEQCIRQQSIHGDTMGRPELQACMVSDLLTWRYHDALLLDCPCMKASHM